MYRRIACLAPLLMLLAHEALPAQVVKGRVTSRDAAIDGAVVELLTADSVVQRTSRTRANGEFRLTGVAPGPFTLQVRRLGFRPARLPLSLHGDTLRLDVQLEPAAVELPLVTINGERDAVLDLPVMGYDTRSLPVTIFTPSQLQAVGANAHQYLDVIRKLRLTFAYVDDNCVRDSGSNLCFSVYLDDRPLAGGEDIDMLRATHFVLDPNDFDHVVFLRLQEGPAELRGTMFLYSSQYTKRIREHRRTRVVRKQ